MSNQYTRYDANDPRAVGRGIPADVLAQLLAGQEVPGWSTAYAPKTIYQGGDAGDYYVPNAGYTEGPQAFQYKDPTKEWYSTYDPSGALMNEGNGNNKMTTKDYLTYLALVVGAGALGGAGGAATGGSGGGGVAGAAGSGAGSGAGASWLSAVPAENAAAINAIGQTAGTVGSSASLLPTWQVAGAAGAGGGLLGGMTAGDAVKGAGAVTSLGGSSGGSSSGVNSMRAGEIAGYQTNGSMPSSAAVQADPSLWQTLSATAGQLNSATGGNLGGLLGAGLGALSSKDQTTSGTKDPWAPAQDFIKQQIAQGQSLSNQYQASPFSDAQKTAYGNLASIINGANANAPNMSDFINRQMSGGTAYDPRDPYKNIGKGVSQIVGPGPSGLLNYFPGKGG